MGKKKWKKSLRYNAEMLSYESSNQQKYMKKIKFPKVKKIKKSTLKNKADKMFSNYIRSVGVCQIAYKDKIKCTNTLQCMHIIGRANHNLRWDTWNALCGCSGHHMYYTSHPWEWTELIKTYWPDRYKYLNEHRNEVWDKDIEAVIKKVRSNIVSS